MMSGGSGGLRLVICEWRGNILRGALTQGSTEIYIINNRQLCWRLNLVYRFGEHGNIRYAPSGLREQHEDVVGIYRS